MAATEIKITAKARFLVRNIVLGNITYLEAINSKAAQDDVTLKDQIDAYIIEQDLEAVIDKTV